MANFKGGSFSYVVERKLQEKLDILQERAEMAMEGILDILSKKVGNSYSYSRQHPDNVRGGISPFDEFRHTYHKSGGSSSSKKARKARAYNSWRAEQTGFKRSLGFRIYNFAKHAKYLFSDTPSYGHAGWRSAKPHKPVKYRGSTYERADQLTKAKWTRFMKHAQYIYKAYLDGRFK